MINLTENDDNENFFEVYAEDDENVPNTGTANLTLVFSNPDNNKPFSITPDGAGKWNLSVKGYHNHNLRLYFYLFYIILDLDYDAGAKIYSLDMELMDGADRFGETMRNFGTILVNVLDTPDQPPLWLNRCFLSSFEENMPGIMRQENIQIKLLIFSWIYLLLN